MAWGQDARLGGSDPALEFTSCPTPQSSITKKALFSQPNRDPNQSICVRGLDRSWEEGKLKSAPATPGETGNQRRRVPGPVPGGQAPSQDGGQGCQ